MTRILYRFVLTACVIAVAICVALVAAYSKVVTEIKAFTTISAVQLFNLPPGVADYLGWIIAFLSAGVVLRYAFKLATGRLSGLDTVIVVVATAAIATGYSFATRDWAFDAQGKPRTFLCPALTPGDLPRIQHDSTDRVLGGTCPAVTRMVIATVLSMRKGILPQQIQPGSLAEYDSLERFDRRSGMPLIFAGSSPSAEDGPVAIYRGAGFDPATGALLEPLAQVTATAARNFFADQDQRRTAEADRRAREVAEREAQKEAEKKAEEERVRQAQEVAAIAEQRRVAAEERAREKEKEAEERRLEIQAQRAQEREAEQQRVELQAQRTREAEALARARQSELEAQQSRQRAASEMRHLQIPTVTYTYIPPPVYPPPPPPPPPVYFVPPPVYFVPPPTFIPGPFFAPPPQMMFHFRRR